MSWTHQHNRFRALRFPRAPLFLLSKFYVLLFRPLPSALYPVLPSRICQIIRHSRSFSPRSITCKGVEPSNASFGRCSHGPIAFAFMISDNASKSRVTSRIFCALDRCGARPAFQYETVRGDAPVTLLTTSFERWKVRERRRTSGSLFCGAIKDEAFIFAPVNDLRRTRPACLFRTDFFCIFMVYYCMQSCMCHAKYLFNSASPNTRASSVLRIRSRNTIRLMPSFTRTDGHNMPAIPEFLTARPNA
jgi:hypothetical protein